MMSDHPRPLSAKFKEDFAYPTVKDRLPVILTKAVDSLHRTRSEVKERLGEKGTEDLKGIVGRLSKLRNELQTDKAFTKLCDMNSDVLIWNNYFDKEGNGEAILWFSSAWLYSECYFYRRIKEAILLSEHLRETDPFEEQKRHALLTSLPSAALLAADLEEIKGSNFGDLLASFNKMFQVALWGNKCDLSISSGAENTQRGHPLDQLEEYAPYILHDDSQHVWDLLQQKSVTKSGQVQLDIILDNAGFELFSDLCFLDFAVSTGLVSRVRLHAKTMPWFVSDVTLQDWTWTLDQLETATSDVLAGLGKKWKNWLADGTWSFVCHDFWCTPYDFTAMEDISPDLYYMLSTSDLIIFKGDLNYRKLTGDFKWDHTVPFSTALRGFQPAPLCALRTLKCDLVVGLEPGQAETTQAHNADWMICGMYSVIQCWFGNC